MKNKEHIVLMADIIDSRKTNQQELMLKFREITGNINKSHKTSMLSPITITLGDEFQAVLKNISSAVQVILELEESLILDDAGFKLRYVIYEGQIDTPINDQIAYGMLGEGLTKAREALEMLKGSNKRFSFNLNKTNAADALNYSMTIFQDITDDWKLSTDQELIGSFIKWKDYKIVADHLGKTRSQIWKRHKSLKIEPYFAIKQVTQYIADQI